MAVARCPSNPPRTASYALAPSQEVRLTELTNEIAATHGSSASGFLPIDRNDEALRWRLMLADVAERTLDMQYYIWLGDDTGVLMLHRVIRAADRGVRVRLLVDDMRLVGVDEEAAAIGDHPNIEFRIYNPWVGRDGGWLRRAMEGVFEFDRVNHRMHNKLMVADNHVAIIGGRNIADEYFGLNQGHNFRDFDALVAGAVVPELSESFDRYWNSTLSYPGSAIPRRNAAPTLAEIREQDAELLAQAADRLQSFPLQPRDWTDRLGELSRRMTVGSADVVLDSPREDRATLPVEVMDSVEELAAGATEEVLVAAAYLIPSKDGIDMLRDLIERGVRVRILTNSLASNDSTLAQQAYARYRRALLEAGIELHELRADAADKAVSDTPPVESNSLALHTKLIVVDRRLAYVGSLNLDPRSLINSELGLIVEDPRFAEKVARLIERDMSPDNSWSVRLTERGRIEWMSSLGAQYHSPASNDFQRLGGMFVGLIEDQL